MGTHPDLSNDNYPEQNNWEQTNFNLHHPVLKVIGLGGGGSNAIARMMELGLKGIEFIAANTDYQVLKNNPAAIKIQLGPTVTRGLGAGGNPEVGKEAAKESSREIAEAITGADMLFITAGMGGGTGTGSIPVVAEIARDMGIVVIAVVTMPFYFEMKHRQRNAVEGINHLRPYTHTLISIPNDRLLSVSPKDITLEVAFHLADDVLRQAVQGITELITETGMINVDFSHVKRLMLLGGGAYMSIGHGHGDHKAKQAIEQALHHPLLEEINLEHAAGIIANFSGGNDLSLFDVQEAVSFLQQQASHDPEIILGVNNNAMMQNRVQVILVVTGLGATTLEEAISQVSQPMQNQVQEDHLIKLPIPSESRKIFSPLPEYMSTTVTSDLDVPAFIRRRARQAG